MTRARQQASCIASVERTSSDRMNAFFDALERPTAAVRALSENAEKLRLMEEARAERMGV